MSDDHEKYLLRVTAGPDYDPATHQIVPVNAPEAIEIENEHMTARLNVRIQGYRGKHPQIPLLSQQFQVRRVYCTNHAQAFRMDPPRRIRTSQTQLTSTTSILLPSRSSPRSPYQAMTLSSATTLIVPSATVSLQASAPP
jgi:hypothetical protein